MDEKMIVGDPIGGNSFNCYFGSSVDVQKTPGMWLIKNHMPVTAGALILFCSKIVFVIKK
jgi:hypothetical protein